MIKKPIEKALEVLEEHITEISTVSEWADKVGYSSTNYFSRSFLKQFNVRPKEVLVQKRIEKVKECIAESPEDIFFCIAQKVGFVDHNALYKFVNRHMGKSLQELKRECEKGVYKFLIN